MEESRSVRNSLKDMPDIILASVNCMGNMRTGQDIDRFRYHHIEKNSIGGYKMNKEVPEEFKNMTLEETKKEIIEMIRELPEESPIHKALYEGIKEIIHNESAK